MERLINSVLVIIIALVIVQSLVQIRADKSVTCFSKSSPCFLKPKACPKQCPETNSTDSKAKVCYLNCQSPICQTECKLKKPNCNGLGSACLDPRFIGGDGVVFYFHGKKNDNFALVSDPNLQINARFIGLRPAGRTRDFTWIQSLGILFASKAFTLEAQHASSWDDRADHLKLSMDGRDLSLPRTHLSSWECEQTGFRVERTSGENSVLISIPDLAEIAVNVVPVTKEDDRVHRYGIPEDDCFAHLEVQFRFLGLSPRVEGVLGRTYRPDFENPAKPGVAMPVLGGEDRYRTSSLLAADCRECRFSRNGQDLDEGMGMGIGMKIREYGVLDCSGNGIGGNGIVCKK